MSKEVEEGDVFLAVGPSSQVREHILEAECSGALAALVDQSLQLNLQGLKLPVFRLAGLAEKRASLASKFSCLIIQQQPLFS